ncbi:F0F1 ATP synthase subunit epsilon [Cellulomonas sp. NPDC089187]|uniref:F0F1 ATP synthase subunit epsilon n=1 Tax=Cellulomonas sp. NPDC089187 TaxID=3154970 RepID=UPI0034121C0C
MAKKLEVDLVAADGSLWSGAARALTAPATDGEIGILPGHTPVLSVLGTGQVRITTEGGSTQQWVVAGGFLSVDDDQVTVVVDGVVETPGSAA